MALSITLTAADGATKQLVLPDPVIAASVSAGLVTNFTMTPGHYLNVDSDKYGVETAGKNYSLTNPDPRTLRFEIHQGDRWAAADSGSNVDRAFVQNVTKSIATSWGAKIPPGTPVNVGYQLMVEPNANGSFVNSSPWFVISDMHNDDVASGVNTSPPFALQLAGNHLQVVARYVQPGGNPGNSSPALKMLTLWTDPNPIRPGIFYDIGLQANFSNSGGGYLKVSINGSQVVNYSGPLGYGQGIYWQYGLYRATAPEIAAANYRNMSVKAG